MPNSMTNNVINQESSSLQRCVAPHFIDPRGMEGPVTQLGTESLLSVL